MKFQHVDPQDAVVMHKDLKAKNSVAIHWGTFALAHEVIYRSFACDIKADQLWRTKQKNVILMRDWAGGGVCSHLQTTPSGRPLVAK